MGTQPERQRPLAADQRAACVSDNGDNAPILRRVTDDFGKVARAALVEAMLSGEARTWLRAAQRFEWARPTPADLPGGRTREELRAKWHELTELANACRARARVLRPRDGIEAEVDEVASSSQGVA